MTRLVLSLAVVLGLLPSGNAAAQSPPELVLHYADLVLYNGQVHTVNRNTPDWTVAEAVAVRDGKFLAVGKSDQILELAGPKTVRIDLAGRTVTPGFIDTHAHPMGAQIPPSEAVRFGRLRLSVSDPAGKQKGLQEIEAFARTHPEGQWMDVNTGNDLVRAFTVEELDRVSPRHPVYVHGTPSYGALNSNAIKALLARYPDIDGIQRTPQGQPTGQVETPVMGLVEMELIPPYPQRIRADANKREMDRYLGAGTTTFSSRMTGHEIGGYLDLERRGMLTQRVAYAHQWAMDNPNWYAFVKRIGDTVGIGSDRLWSTGASITSVDGTLGDNCVSIEKRRPAGSSGPRGDCRALPGMPRYEAMKAALRDGIRISSVHAAGDRSIDAILNMFLELQKEGVPVAQLRPTLDHCTMISGDNIKKAQQIPGMTFSCAPKYVLGNTAQRASEIWDREIANNWVVPTKALLDAGVKVVWETDTFDGETFEGRRDGFPALHPMLQMQVFLSRRDRAGETWGAKNAVDRRTALLMMTRWGAEYVLREDRIGSIEPGKLADLVVLDGDWLRAPDNRMVDLSVLMTVVQGQVVYVDPAFADKVGRQALARVQHPFSAVFPAYRASDELRRWADAK